MDPGAEVCVHSHKELEETVVLSGEFSGDERTYRTGDYCARAGCSTSRAPSPAAQC
jgi:anti-sigma factor ChrR (cupin superfamily)